MALRVPIRQAGSGLPTLGRLDIPIEANPKDPANAGDLLKLLLGQDTIYSIPGAGGGTNVVANPGGTNLPELLTVSIGGVDLMLPAGGSGTNVEANPSPPVVTTNVLRQLTVDTTTYNVGVRTISSARRLIGKSRCGQARRQWEPGTVTCGRWWDDVYVDASSPTHCRRRPHADGGAHRALSDLTQTIALPSGADNFVGCSRRHQSRIGHFAELRNPHDTLLGRGRVRRRRHVFDPAANTRMTVPSGDYLRRAYTGG